MLPKSELNHLEVSNFALSFWSGGTTAAEESTNIIDDLQKMLLQLSSVAMYYIKNG